MSTELRNRSEFAFGLGATDEVPGNICLGKIVRWQLVGTSQILDQVTLFAAFVVALLVSGISLSDLPLRYAFLWIAMAVICYLTFLQSDLYKLAAIVEEIKAVKCIVAQWTLMFLGLAALAALSHQSERYSRLWFTVFYLGGVVALAAQRSIFARIIKTFISRGYSTQDVVFVGFNELSVEVIKRFRLNNLGIRIVGVFDDRHEYIGKSIFGVPVRGPIDDLVNFAMAHSVDTAIIAIPITAADRIEQIILKLRILPINVRVLPGDLGLRRLSPIRLERSEVPGVQLIRVQDKPLAEWQFFSKGVFDRVAAAIALIILSPVLVCCAIGIALSSRGDIFFRQTRIGYKGREFNIIKFRTMHMTGQISGELTRRNDPRVFKFGGLLRKLSLDELPQLINVLRGDMSLVGPRPHMPEARADGKLYFDAVNEYAWRHRVKPGITGWAQVNGWRGPTETIEQIERRVEHDIYYIENWSLTLDTIILIRTVLVGFFGRNAF